MRRSLTISLVLHALAVVALVLSGGLVSRDRRYPPVYQVNLIAAPRAETLRPPRERPRPPTPEPEREPEPEPEPEPPPEPEPEILEEEEELVPEETPPPTPPEEPEPEPAPEEPEEEPEEPREAPPAPPERPVPESPTPDAGGNEAELDLTVEGETFAHQWYLDGLVNKIGRNWKRTPSKQPLRALVYFRVERSGKVSGMEVRESSGDFLFDQAALRAVADASPMPPLPEDYRSDYLGVYFDFNETAR